MGKDGLKCSGEVETVQKKGKVRGAERSALARQASEV